MGNKFLCLSIPNSNYQHCQPGKLSRIANKMQSFESPVCGWRGPIPTSPIEQKQRRSTGEGIGAPPVDVFSSTAAGAALFTAVGDGGGDSHADVNRHPLRSPIWTSRRRNRRCKYQRQAVFGDYALLAAMRRRRSGGAGAR
jgi:hypothetical protein